MLHARRRAFVFTVSLLFGTLLLSSWLAGPPSAAAQIDAEFEETATPTPICEPPTETPTPQPTTTETLPPGETPTIEVTPSPTPEDTATPVASETTTSEPTPSATPEPPTATPTASLTTETLTPTPEPPTETPLPSATPTSTESITETSTHTPTPTLWFSTPSPTPTASLTPTPPEAPIYPSGALASNTLVIHQVYGGGGNAGAPYLNDFIEVRNLSALPVNTTGWSVQYAPATGSTWQVTPLSGTVAPGGLLLIQLASGGANGIPLPVPDLTGTVNLAATAGKVALVNNTTPLAGTCPLTFTVDFLGYGTTANCAETAPLANLSNTLAALRIGPTDTDNNAVDFTRTAPSPRGQVAPTPTPTPTQPFTPSLQIIINEVAWGGTAANSADEWIELYNPNAFDVNVTGWTLTGSDGSPAITLNGVIAAGGYFLLERTDDNTVSDIAADLIYTGDLSNGGETLTLRDAGGGAVDSANLNGGPWPAGSGAPGYFSMERTTPAADTDANWHSNNGLQRNGRDANGQPLNGTPRQPNSAPPPTATPTPTLAPFPPFAIVINEVAWAGTVASSSDEWIELHNPGAVAINLSAWTLSDGGDINLVFPNGFVIAAGGYALLERTDDSTVSDIAADLIYSGGLNNDGETLTLRDGLGNVIDTANADGGGWPAGAAGVYASMERVGAGAESWRTHSGAQFGRDADGNPIRGTPKNLNSLYLPTPTPQPFPAGVLLNEFLAAPASGASEFIEIINTGAQAVDVSGWQLDDIEGGSAPRTLPAGTLLQPGEIRAFDYSGLNNDGDSVRLLYPDGRVADEFAYDEADENVSFARLPDGGEWSACGAPTPGQPNVAGPCGAGGSNRGDASRPQVENAVPIGIFRTWPAGAWATITGRVTAPAPLFGRRTIFIQDDTGGIAVYLGRGDWPPLEVGQTVSVFGYQRRRASGRIEMYARNLWHIAIAAPDGFGATPRTGVRVSAETSGQLVTISGRVVRLESSAFWLDDGSGAVRVFFASTTGVRRPKVARGQLWTVTGIVTEMSATRTRAAGWQLQPRFANDAQPTSGALAVDPSVTLEPTPTEEPTATPGP
ncbi:MAG: lamin tail domain-containing protein [Anaerolineales bacterium]|nr:lamin tail domain-containing protein [Anaerolineales bacterium]